MYNEGEMKELNINNMNKIMMLKANSPAIHKLGNIGRNIEVNN